MSSKVLTLLGFASKAGKLSYGMDAAVSAIKQKKAKLVLAARDVSQKSEKEIIFQSEKYGVKYLPLENYDMDTVAHAVGRKCGILSVNDDSFSSGLITALEDGRKLNDK